MKTALALMAVLAVACSDGTPASPTAPSAANLSVTSPLAELLTSETIQASARATLMNGSQQVVTPIWSIDNATVASVEPNGRVTGLKHGSVLLVATFGGTSASVPLRVIANYRGVWNGTVTVTDCVYWDPRFCGRLNPTGMRTVDIEQSGDVARAVLRDTDERADLSGHIRDDGALVLSGQVPPTILPSGRVVRGSEILGWRTRVSAGETMSGEYTTIRINDGVYPFVVVYEIGGWTRATQ